jgi:DHA1 family tetracycline resistance protein-like MFS transporter
MAGIGVCAIIVQGGLVGRVTARLGERGALMLALAFGVAAFLTYGLAPTGPLFLVGVPLLALWGIGGPAAQGLMSRRVSAAEQGQLQGANGSTMGIASLIGPIVFTQSFAWFIGPASRWHVPGAPFVLAALLLVLSIFIAWPATQSRQGP